MGGELMAMEEPRYGGNRGILNKLVNHYAFGRVNRLMTLSQHAAELFEGQMRSDAPWYVTPFGIDLERFSTTGDVASIGGTPKFLLVGSLQPIKGCDVALRAFAAVAPKSGAMLHIIGAADALVVASHFETQSMVALEAAACGCPVIGSRVGIIEEIAVATFAPKDETALAAELRRVIASPDFRAREGPRARARVEQSYEVKSRVADVESLYESLLDPQ